MIEVLQFSLGEPPSGVLPPPSLVLIVLVEEVHAREGQNDERPHERTSHRSLRHLAQLPQQDHKSLLVSIHTCAL